MEDRRLRLQWQKKEQGVQDCEEERLAAMAQEKSIEAAEVAAARAWQEQANAQIIARHSF